MRQSRLAVRSFLDVIAEVAGQQSRLSAPSRPSIPARECMAGMPVSPLPSAYYENSSLPLRGSGRATPADSVGPSAMRSIACPPRKRGTGRHLVLEELPEGNLGVMRHPWPAPPFVLAASAMRT